MLLVPTRVGMILYIATLLMDKHSCPHTRGDDPGEWIEEQGDTYLSPHAWG